jgi:hypothetical protein
LTLSPLQQNQLTTSSAAAGGGGDGDDAERALQDFFYEFLIDPESTAVAGRPARPSAGAAPAPQSYRNAEPPGVQPYRDALDSFFAGGLTPEPFGRSGIAVSMLMTEWGPTPNLLRCWRCPGWG